MGDRDKETFRPRIENRLAQFRVGKMESYQSTLEPTMTKQVLAEYLADEKKLKLDEPLEGIEDHERVTVTLESAPLAPRGPDSWRKLAGSLSAEAGASLAAAVEEAFGPINDDPNRR